MKIAIISCLCLSLASCAILEYIWLVPRESGNVVIPSSVTRTQALNLFGKVVLKRLVERSKPSITYINEDEGVIEIGPWRRSNVAGYAARAKIKENGSSLYFTVKGAGPYYVDLPVKEAVDDIVLELNEIFRTIVNNNYVN